MYKAKTTPVLAITNYATNGAVVEAHAPNEPVDLVANAAIASSSDSNKKRKSTVNDGTN